MSNGLDKSYFAIKKLLQLQEQEGTAEKPSAVP
jgi:hypothetical protein